MLLSLLVATLVAAVPVKELAAGHQAFLAQDYGKAARVLGALPPKLPRNKDYALYLAAESEFYAGHVARARALFEQLGADRESRFAPLAPWRVADCLWLEGRQADAAAAYRKLVGKPPAGVDVVVAKFRLADQARPPDAELFRKIHVEHPSHPLADEAARRAGPAPATTAAPSAPLDPPARLKRAAKLADGKHYDEAIAELEALQLLPPELAVERDLQLGMAKFRTRHQYPQAAAILQSVVPRLEGERAASAAFHAARALARAHRESEAVPAFLALVERFPTSRLVPEAQFVAGWLEFNSGNYRECIAPLRATIDRFGRSAFANDAAWYLALSYHFLGRPDEALTALDEYLKLPGADAEVQSRAAYWRGRFLLAKNDSAAAKARWRELVEHEPLSYYGLLARARLRKAGVKVGVPLPEPEKPKAAKKGAKKAAKKTKKPEKPKLPRDPLVLRTEELAEAGLTVAAGVELQRGEDGLERRLGRDQALVVLLELYPRYDAFRRAYQLGETRGSDALKLAPAGDTRLVWEAALPRAYRVAVEKQAKRAAVPPLFVWSIMHKETGFGPQRVSPADARGLLQVLPSLGAELATRHKLTFFEDDLYDPELNIRYGVINLGELFKKFRGQAFLVAGAYNGGVAAVTRWLDRNGRRPLDEFVELVGFRESREYIKRVSAIYARYTYLYTGKPYELPLTVNRAYRQTKTTSRPSEDPD